MVAIFCLLPRLQPDTLDRCELVCRKLYAKYGGVSKHCVIHQLTGIMQI